MVLFILALGKIIKDMEMEHFFTKIKDAFKEDGILIKQKALEDFIIQMEIFIKVITKIVNQMGKVNILVKVQDKNLLVCMSMINTKEKENKFGKTVLYFKVCLKMD
jgi:hypothetical protein